MGDGIINMANIGWLILLGVMYAGASKINNETFLTAEQKEKVEALISKLGGYPPVYLVVVLWVALRVLWALGWQLQLEMLIVVSASSYVFRQTDRMKAKVACDIRRELSEAADPTTVLGTNLPEWVTFPSANRVQWLNTMVAGMWPSVVGATDNSIRSALEPLLEASKPSFVYGFKLKSASIGNKPIVFNGIQHHAYGSTETTLDVSCSWDAEMDIRLLVRVPGPDMEVLIRNFEMRMTMRLTMGPHIPQWPCFANMAISLVGSPEIDFDITAAKISLDAVPGLGSWIDTFIRKTLVGMLAYPKGFTIPIVQGYKLDMGKAAGALGTLKIQFLHIDNLLDKYNKYKKTPFYCKIAMVDSEKKRARGRSYVGFDTTMTDSFNFTLYDNTSVLRIWMYFDVVGNDVCVGECDVPTKVLIESTTDEHELILLKTSDPARRRRVSLFVKPQFLSFEGTKGASTAPPPDLPTRNLSADFVQTVEATGIAPSVPNGRSSLSPSASGAGYGGSSSGTLFVTVHSAANLKNLERLSKSDPYVFLRIKGATAKSAHIDNNLNPTFNFEAELVSHDSSNDVLRINLVDKNDLGADKLMGTTTIPIASVIASRNETMTGEFRLDPQGTVKITMRYLRHS